MDLTTAKEFLADCQETFEFLVSEYGFRPAVLSADEGSLTVTFVGRVLAIECVLDERERWVDFKVALLHNGRPPREYEFTADGRRVRDHVSQVLTRRGLRGFGYKPVEDSGELRLLWRQMLANYASLLKRSGQAILTEDPLLFEG